MRTFSLMLLLIAINPIADAQTLYKTVGADGKVVYSDRPPAEGKAQALQQEQLPISIVPGMPPPAPGKAAAPKKAAVQNGQAVLYMAQWCGYCRLARGYLARNGIAYREIDIDTPDGKAAFAEIGGRGVPVLLADGQRHLLVAGFFHACMSDEIAINFEYFARTRRALPVDLAIKMRLVMAW